MGAKMTQDVETLLHKIQNNEVFKDFYFIGGTALSYYLSHRVSYDFAKLNAKEKLEKIKQKLIRLIVSIELAKKEALR